MSEQTQNPMKTEPNTHMNNEPALYGIKTTMEIIFPDEKSRPSLRAFNEWKNRGYFPQLRVGRRVFLDPVQVRKSLEKRFTIHAID